ncbi:MAG: CDP-diacylglycerol--glycerol-3-phosphate 3-phosphatidyltransferase [Verrucomicrobiae bacterium]|nr:CDP-diacylglycerol--glycerol-3-phosphate 3-phosphatidyltransferase [Verrucomicrobiae bacterium]
MNLPNKLTLSRFVMAGVFTALMLADTNKFLFTQAIALVVFVVAILTDFLDGRMARRMNLKTNFGALMDPLADKVLISAAFVCFVAKGYLGAFGPWAVIIIITREFMITGLRLLATSKDRVISADNLGKHKTAWQMITIVVVLADESLKQMTSHIESTETMEKVYEYFDWAIFISLTAAVVLTVYSGVVYLWKNRHLLQENN